MPPRFSVTCPACHRQNPDGSHFCNGCGSALGAAASPPAAMRRPRDYTPGHLARKILRSRSALEGERKQVTVLFVDLKSSLELSGAVDPEDWHAVMDRFFEILAEGIHRYEGTINQYTGDGVMALFGAPIAHEDHAQRACYAALHLKESVRAYAQELRRERGLDFHVRLGMNSGDVVVGRIGDDLRMDYTAQGSVVGVAARMQQIAEPGRIYLAEETARLVPGYFELEELGDFQIRGLALPVPVRLLTGVGPVRSRLELARARGFSRLVGRTEELARLEDALARASRGDPVVVALRAGPGLGKSRLCFEFAERCRERGLAVNEAQCLSHGGAVPFLPILQLLRSAFGVRDEIDSDAIRDRIAGRVVRTAPDQARALPELLDFLGVPDPENDLPPLGPAAREQQLLEVTRRVLEPRRPDEAAVVIVEDLHWIDTASDAFLAKLLDRCAGNGVLFVLNFRPEYRATWTVSDACTGLGLAPLGSEDADALLVDLLGSHPSLDALRHRLVVHTGGNPFFLEEVVRSLVESEALVGERGAYRCVRSALTLELPASVQAVLAARIDRLDDLAKSVLFDAAVLGRRFSEAMLRAVSEAEGEALDDALQTLVASELVYEESLFPEPLYAFQHPLTHQTAFYEQLTSRRRRVHRSAAEALEVLYAEHQDEHAAVLAHHWESAGEAPRAARWHRRAAIWAGVNRAPESLHHWRSIRVLAGDDPQDAEQLGLAVEARGQLIVGIGRLGGSIAEVDRLHGEARSLAARSGEPRAMARMLIHYAHFNVNCGRVAIAERSLAEALECIDRVDDDELRTAALYLRALPQLLVGGRCGDAIPLLDAACEASRESPDRRSEVLGFAVHPMALCWRGYTLALRGRLAEARREIDRATQLAGTGQPGVILQVRNCALAFGDLLVDRATALVWGNEALELAQGMGFGTSLAQIAYGRACLLIGASDEALALFEAGLGSTRESHSYTYQELPYRVAVARAQLAQGDVAAAKSSADLAVASGDGRGFYASDAHLVRALVRLAGDEHPDEVAADIAEAERLVGLGGAVCRRPYLHQLRGEQARRCDDHVRRNRELDLAAAAFRAMGAEEHATRVEDARGVG